MTNRINQEQRNALILDRARRLFSELGYPEVSLKLVASRCGLSRTVIYRHYKSKRELFDSVISNIAADLGHKFLNEVARHPELSCSEKLRMVMLDVLGVMTDNIGLLDAITEYLIDQRRQGESVGRRVRRHTLALRRTLTDLVREGMGKGEFQPVQCNLVGDILFGQLESAALQLAVTQTANIETIRSTIDMSLYCLRLNSPQDRAGEA